MTEVLRGPDVSAYQGSEIDWHAVKGSGASFAFCKASEGVGYKDATFDRNWVSIKDAGLIRGCYHFLRGDMPNDPVDEAAWFLKCLGKPEAGDIIILDVEVGRQSVGAAALAWLRHVEQVLGYPPLVYSFLSFAQSNLQDPALSRYPLFLSLFDGTVPQSVPPWSEVTIHQHTDHASYPGIPGSCDESVVARSLAQLRALGKPAAAAPPQPSPAPSPRPHKVVITKTMMLRKDPHHDDIYDPAQLVYAKAVLDVVGPEVGGWLPVHAGTRTGYVLQANTRPVP